MPIPDTFVSSDGFLIAEGGDFRAGETSNIQDH